MSTNGLIAFGNPWSSFFNVPFPSFLTNFFLIAPFWDDANTNNGGTISYEIHTSGSALEMVSDFVSARTNTEFEGYWMMVVLWDQVPPFSFFGTTNGVRLCKINQEMSLDVILYLGKHIPSRLDHRQPTKYLCHLHL